MMASTVNSGNDRSRNGKFGVGASHVYYIFCKIIEHSFAREYSKFSIVIIVEGEHRIKLVVTYARFSNYR